MKVFFESDISLLELQSKIDFDMNMFSHNISNHLASSNDLRLKYVNQKMKILFFSNKNEGFFESENSNKKSHEAYSF
jgi:hypothetical protein